MKKLKNLKISSKRWKELTRNHFRINQSIDFHRDLRTAWSTDQSVLIRSAYPLPVGHLSDLVLGPTGSDPWIPGCMFKLHLVDCDNRMLYRTVPRTGIKKKKLRSSWPKNESAWPWKKNLMKCGNRQKC